MSIGSTNSNEGFTTVTGAGGNWPLPPLHLRFRDILIKDPNFTVILGLVKNLESMHHDKLAVILTNLFTHPHRSTDPPNPLLYSPVPLSPADQWNPLLEKLIELEIKEHSESASQLFAHHSFVSKLFGHLCSLHGIEFLETCLGSSIRQLVRTPGTWEVDPERATSVLSRMAQAESVMVVNKEIAIISAAIATGENPPKKTEEEDLKFLSLLKQTSVSNWSPPQVALWIMAGALFPQYAEFFLTNKIIGDKLLHITGQELTDLGILHLQHRQKILKSIKNLEKGDFGIVKRLENPHSEVIQVMENARINLLNIIDEHVFKIQDWAKIFLESIIQHLDSHLPVVIKSFLIILNRKVTLHFDSNLAQKIIRMFFINRFICPAITGPVQYRLVSSQEEMSNSRRGLILVAKLLSGLVKSTPFAEEYMLPFNSFLDSFTDSFYKTIKDTFTGVKSNLATKPTKPPKHSSNAKPLPRMVPRGPQRKRSTSLDQNRTRSGPKPRSPLVKPKRYPSRARGRTRGGTNTNTKPSSRGSHNLPSTHSPLRNSNLPPTSTTPPKDTPLTTSSNSNPENSSNESFTSNSYNHDYNWRLDWENPSELTTMDSLNNIHYVIQTIEETLFLSDFDNLPPSKYNTSTKSWNIWDQLALILDHLEPVFAP